MKRLLFLGTALALVASLFPVAAHQAYAATSGPNNGATFANETFTGSNSTWTNPGNAATSNNAYATIASFSTPLNTGTSAYLKATNFGFSIPSGATIDGITVQVEKYASNADVTDNRVRIVKGGTVGATDRSAGGLWATSDTGAYTTYGGVSDKWGETWTPSDINSTGFGFAISAIDGGAITTTVPNIDHIRITVTYTTPTKLAFTGQPSSAVAGATLGTVTVQVQDGSSNLMPNATNTVALTLECVSCSVPTLYGTTSVAAVAGVATFTGLNVQVAGTYTLRATTAGLTDAVSSSFNITHGTADHLEFGVQPTNTKNSHVITPAITVRVLDQYGNLVSNATNTVEIDFDTNAGAGDLFGDVSNDAVAGVATFNDLKINRNGTGYTLAAAAAGLTNAVSDPFNITKNSSYSSGGGGGGSTTTYPPTDPTPAPTPTPEPETDKAHKPGSVVITSDGTVWFITTNNVRRPFTSAGAFLSYGFLNWSMVTPANAADLALAAGSFIAPQDGSLFCATSTKGTDVAGECSLITNGKKAAFTTAAVFTGQGFSFANAEFGDSSFLEKTTDITSATEAHRHGVLVNDNGTIKLVGASSLMGIPSQAVFQSWGYSNADVVPANAADKAMSDSGIMKSRTAGQLSPQ